MAISYYQKVLELLPADDTDDWLHLVLGVALLGSWYAAKREAEEGRLVRAT